MAGPLRHHRLHKSKLQSRATQRRLSIPGFGRTCTGQLIYTLHFATRKSGGGAQLYAFRSRSKDTGRLAPPAPAATPPAVTGDPAPSSSFSSRLDSPSTPCCPGPPPPVLAFPNVPMRDDAPVPAKEPLGNPEPKRAGAESPPPKKPESLGLKGEGLNRAAPVSTPAVIPPLPREALWSGVPPRAFVGGL